MRTDTLRPATSGPDTAADQQDLYEQAVAAFGAPLERLARAHEADPDRRQDLLQEIHLALWRSLAAFDGRCSLRTWVYRVAHNTAASHVIRDHRRNSRVLVGLEGIEAVADVAGTERALDEREALSLLYRLIHELQPLDRLVILSYLEDMDAASIAEISGLSPGNVATKVHRIKALLAKQFRQGRSHAD